MKKLNLLNEILASVEVERIMEDIRTICDAIPSRLAGTEACDRMAQFSRDRLSDIGLKSEIAAYETTLSLPAPAWVEREGERIEAQTFGHSGDTPGTGLTGTMMDAGGGSESELAAIAAGQRDAVGLCDLAKGPPRQEKQRLARALGLKALIMYAPGDDDGDCLPFGSVKSLWGHPSDTRKVEACIPCVGIKRCDGLRLRRMALGEAVGITMYAESGKIWGQAPVTLGAMDVEERDFVLVGGHQDSWYGPSATDNASGSAMMLELARILLPYRQELMRGITFAFWSGHETGTMVGSSSWVDDNWERIREHLVAYVEVDQPGIRGAAVWEVAATDEVADFALAAHSSVAPGDPHSIGRASRTGDSSFFGAGIPTINACQKFDCAQMTCRPGTPLGWWHHTVHNTIDRIDPDNLEKFARVTLTTLCGLLQNDVLPFRYAPAAARIEKAGKHFACQTGLPVPSVLSRLMPVAASLDEVTNRIRERGVRDESTVRLNQRMRRLNQVLVPLRHAYSAPWEQDSYGLTELREAVPMLALRTPPDPEARCERTYRELGRKRAANRFQMQIDVAVREMDELCREFS
ncbi:MAG: M28 family peptidase [Hyphomicrobiaceae bacterium]|nr:M28 family peptidase [Hyphomicrobiaceae bacterium]